MQIPNKFNALSNANPDIIQTLKSATSRVAQDLNCMRIGIIQEFYPEDLTALVQIAGKRTAEYNKDGTQQLKEYSPVFAKVCYCSPFVTFPIVEGMECVLLFSDREIESWFTTGEAAGSAFPRMHSMTDAVAIVGLRSLPKMIEILADCLNLFYGTSNISIAGETININSGTVQAANLQAMNGASGNITDSQGKTLAKVEYGIITEIY